MALLTKKFHFFKTSETTANIYSTTTEAGSNYIRAYVDKTNGYIPIGELNHVNATIGRVLKNGITYAILSTGSIPYTKKTYTSAGTFTFTVPSGITRVKLTLAGGGGGGGNNYTYKYYYSGCKSYSSGYKTIYGGTGGTGGLYSGTVTVTSGSTYSITVGAGGAALKAGGASKFGNLATATGGGAGTSAYTYTSGEYTYYQEGTKGSNGTPSGAGGDGGSNGGGSGGTGWVYIEYGQGIN